MKILKLDIAKQTGWALTDKWWLKDKGNIYHYGSTSLWGREAILPGNKVDLTFHFVVKLIEKYKPDEIWFEDLNYFRNKVTARSLLHQQAGMHLAALKMNTPILSVPTKSSFRKMEAAALLERTANITVDNFDEGDAIMLGENRRFLDAW